MKVAHCLSFLLIPFVLPTAFSQKVSTSAGPSTSQPLQVVLAKAPFWKNNCLWLNIRRVNNSRFPIFLPDFNEITIYASVTDATNALGQGSGQAWLPVYGQGDIVSSDVTRLGPGKSNLVTYCISDTFPIVDSEKKMNRQVRLQGKLRIYASYFLEAQKWQYSKQQSQDTSQTPPAKRKNADRGNGGTVLVEIPIPCAEHLGKEDCVVPPPIFQGERAVTIPDVGE
jgi:hypothetical protein